MGWAGIAVLGLVVGFAGWWLHPRRARGPGGLVVALLAALAGALLANAAGRVSGAFFDGETLQWPVCTAAALVAVTVAVGLRTRRATRRAN